MKKLLFLGLLLVSGASMYAMEDKAQVTNQQVKDASAKLDDALENCGLLLTDLEHKNLSEDLLRKRKLLVRVYGSLLLLKRDEKTPQEIDSYTIGLNEAIADLKSLREVKELSKSDEHEKFNDREEPVQKKQKRFSLPKRLLFGSGMLAVCMGVVGGSAQYRSYAKRVHRNGKQTVLDRLFAKGKSVLKRNAYTG